VRVLAAASAGLVLALFGAELVARLQDLEGRWLNSFVPRAHNEEFHRVSADPDLLYEMVPGTVYDFPDAGYDGSPTRVTIDPQGFRTPPRPLARADGVVRILCLGGSNTFGARVNDDETWPALLEAELQRRVLVGVEVWNWGVSGYMNRQKAALGRRGLRELSPDLILVQVANQGRRYLLYGSDAVPMFRANPSMYTEYLVGAPTVGAGVHWWLWQHSALLRTWVVGRNRLGYRESFDAYFGENDLVNDERGAQDLVRLSEAAEGQARVMVFYTPATGPFPAVERAGLPEIDLRGVQHEFGDEGRDIHPGARVYRWYAEKIADELHKTDRWCPPLRFPIEEDP
jgi:hypothetical protein